MRPRDSIAPNAILTTVRELHPVSLTRRALDRLGEDAAGWFRQNVVVSNHASEVVELGPLCWGVAFELTDGIGEAHRPELHRSRSLRSPLDALHDH